MLPSNCFKLGGEEYMCDFIGHEIRDKLRTRKTIEAEGPELEKSEEHPITVVQYSNYSPENIQLIFYFLIDMLFSTYDSVLILE
jgi:hypothetical protein